jgi:hypothetical protein
MSAMIDITGARFGRLEVVCRSQNIGPHTTFTCKCDCGNRVDVRSQSLRKGESNSCGCLHSDNMRTRKTVHGLYRCAAYNSWASMLQRCTNPKHLAFKNYGGRGVVVCDGMQDFSQFHALLGDRPSGMTLDRINNNGNYSCGQCDNCLANGLVMNCRWANRTTQNNNKRKVVKS